MDHSKGSDTPPREGHTNWGNQGHRKSRPSSELPWAKGRDMAYFNYILIMIKSDVLSAMVKHFLNEGTFGESSGKDVKSFEESLLK